MQRGEDITDIEHRVSLYEPTGRVIYDHDFMLSIKDFRAKRGNGVSPLGVVSTEIPASLMEVLQRHRSAAATDPRDKIYAFLSLAREFASGSPRRQVFKPDYRKSTREVYLEATKLVIESDGGLDVLSLKEDEVDRNGSDIPLPSWVPDFSVNRPAPINSQPRMWKASGSWLRYTRPIYHAGDVMEVEGAEIGAIGKVSERYMSSGPSEPLITGIIDLYSSMAKNLRVYPPEIHDGLREFLGPWRESLLKPDGDGEEQDRQEVVWRTPVPGSHHLEGASDFGKPHG